MQRIELERFFERLLAEGGGSGEVPLSAQSRAALASSLARARSAHTSARDKLGLADLAAYCDGALDAAEAETFLAAYVREGGDVHELEAAGCFLSRVAAERTPVPPDLLARTIAQAQADAPRPARARQSRPLVASRGKWAWAGGALAAVLSIFVIGERVGTIPAPRRAASSISISSQPQTAEAALNTLSARVLEPPAAPVQQQLAQADPPKAASPSVPRAPAAVAAKPLVPPEHVLVTGSPTNGAPVTGVSIASLDAPQAEEQRTANATPNPVKETEREPVSTFAAEVDTASYGEVRRFLAKGDMPPARAVRVDEMINYFDYHYAAPKNRSAPFEPTVAVYKTPWNPDTQILHVGIKGFGPPPGEPSKVSGALFTIAKDVKIQVEFNPAKIAQYRLIGYETRGVQNRDFVSDKVEDGDIGSGYTVTALYEITPVGSKALPIDHLHSGLTRPSRGSMTDELATLRIVYKLPAEKSSRTITRMIENRDIQHDFAKVPADLRFAAAVAGAGQLLRHDPYIKSFDYGRVLVMAEAAKGEDEFGYRGEFIGLIRRLQTMARANIADATRSGELGAREPVAAMATPPKPMSRHQVSFDDYPPISRRLGEQGTAKVKYLVAADGSVGDCDVMSSSGSQRLDDAACIMVKRWVFKPATVTDGTAVAMWLDADIAFQLR